MDGWEGHTIGRLCVAQWSIDRLPLQSGYDKWCLVLPSRLDYLHFLHGGVIWIYATPVGPPLHGPDNYTSPLCYIYQSEAFANTRRSYFTTYLHVSTASSRRRIYCVMSAQMLVGRTVAQEEHNSIIAHDPAWTHKYFMGSLLGRSKQNSIFKSDSRLNEWLALISGCVERVVGWGGG